MKVKISITIAEEIFKSIARLRKKGESHSAVIERLLRITLIGQARRAKDLKDLEIINKYAAQLNDEAEDVLRYQVET